MVTFREDTDLAFVQYSNANTISWAALATGRPPLPFVQSRYSGHLNSKYIPHAHGLRLLTDTHLLRATDLSDWIIEPVGAGRHLVQAKNLGPGTPTSTLTRKHS
jgi:hypothetical protein